MVNLSDNNNIIERTVLLIGRTGGGKSALANSITKSNEFQESGFVVSQTKLHQVKVIELDGVRLKVVDTIGIGDTELDYKDVLYRIADACHTIKDGLHQVFFVTSNRFTEEEFEAFDLLRSVIFNQGICKFITIIRTNTHFFLDPVQCDINDQHFKNDPKMGPLVNSCNKIIYVNNQPRVSYLDNEISDGLREKSRLRVMLHLRGCDQIYKPKELDQLEERIGSYMTENEKLQSELQSLNVNILEGKNKIQELSSKFDQSKLEIDKLHLNNVEKQKQLDQLIQKQEQERKEREDQLKRLEQEKQQREIEYQQNLQKTIEETKRQIESRQQQQPPPQGGRRRRRCTIQ
eukprot:gene11680-14301_t